MHVTGGWAEGRTCLGTQARTEACLVAQSLRPEKSASRPSCERMPDTLIQAPENAIAQRKKGDQ